MSDKLDARELAVVNAALARWDLPQPSEIVPLAAGGHVHKITIGGQSYVLKDVSDAADVMRMEFTHDVLAHVAGKGVKVPIPLAAQSGQYVVSVHGRSYGLREFIESDEQGDPTEPTEQAETFYFTGQAIASLHRALASYSLEDATRRTWRDDFAARVPEWLSALSGGLPDSQAAMVKGVSVTRGTEIEAAMRSLPEQLIHRDCHPGNILLKDGRVAGFIDCDHICIGPRVFDLAYYAVHHVKWVTDVPEATSRWLANLPKLLAGYKSQQALKREEIGAFPYAMMTYHLLLTNWFMNAKHWEPIELEVRALAWLNERVDKIAEATKLSAEV